MVRRTVALAVAAAAILTVAGPANAAAPGPHPSPGPHSGSGPHPGSGSAPGPGPAPGPASGHGPASGPASGHGLAPGPASGHGHAPGHVAPDAGYVGGGREPGARLTLSYMAEAGFAAAVKLDCDPPGGGHPKPAEACAELAAVGGDPDLIEPARYFCILIYTPITAEITGDWHGTPVSWRHTYGNNCEMRRALGVLFAF